jgi:murein DD-endopeptidase MepM/ murein hydrolase activator NlpD
MRRTNRLRIGFFAASAASVVLVASCGQVHGVHADARTSGTAAGRIGASPNGENQGICVAPSPVPGATATPSPPPGCRVVGFEEVIRITRTAARTNRRGGHVQVRIDGHPQGDPFVYCPVHGQGYYSDDFGAPRFSGGFHRHAGNDIFAALGTPIVAPFDGRVEATPNSLGGLAVSVYGANGYAYNAHLSRYGALGNVKAGTVVGFVGNTGDAAGGPYHDHFEWHPNPLPPPPLHVSPYGSSVLGPQNDPAIDPFPFLQGVCG